MPNPVIKKMADCGDLDKLLATIRVFDEASNATTLRLWVENDEYFRVQILEDGLMPKALASFIAARQDLLRLGRWFTSTVRLI